MDIKVNKGAHHRISAAKSQHFRPDGGKDGTGVYSVPKATAEALIERGVATAVGKPTESKEA
tara:strand:- start:847 stop:1032 length:186 start_codon:yes stop_codon:yes gene_type:complete